MNRNLVTPHGGFLFHFSLHPKMSPSTPFFQLHPKSVPNSYISAKCWHFTLLTSVSTSQVWMHPILSTAMRCGYRHDIRYTGDCHHVKLCPKQRGVDFEPEPSDSWTPASLPLLSSCFPPIPAQDTLLRGFTKLVELKFLLSLFCFYLSICARASKR